MHGSSADIERQLIKSVASYFSFLIGNVEGSDLWCRVTANIPAHQALMGDI